MRKQFGCLKSAFVGAIRRLLTPAKRVFERSAWRLTMVTEKAQISPTAFVGEFRVSDKKSIQFTQSLNRPTVNFLWGTPIILL